MATYSWTAPDLQQRGPVVNAAIAISTPVERILRTAGLPVPLPEPVTALIDTGAFCSAINRDTAMGLGLQPVGVTYIKAPGETARIVRTLQYAVRIILPGLVVFESTVIEAQVDEKIDAVLGRDVLAGAVFVYVGYTGQCTIAF